MAKFRLAAAMGKYAERVNKFVRPPMPKWLKTPYHFKQQYTNKGTYAKNSHSYWSKIYWATPPWINDEQVAEMKRLHNTCPEGHHLDHVVPLKSPIVCGLHVPWNMQHLTIFENYQKSNHDWPGHPNEDLSIVQLDLF